MQALRAQHRKLYAGCWLAVALFAAAGCAKPKPPAPPPEPTLLRLSVVASDDVNPDIKGRASPISVRIYELKSVSGFSGASFMELYEKDKDVLAADMQSREVVQLAPKGDKSFPEKEVKADTTHLAAFAGYRDWQHARWSAVTAIPARKISKVAVRVDKLGVSLQLTEVPHPPKQK